MNLLVDILSTQDFSREHAASLIEQQKEWENIAKKDPVSAIIIEAYGFAQGDAEQFQNALDYYIRQLGKARDAAI